MRIKPKDYLHSDFERLLCLLVLLAMSYMLYGIRVLFVAGVGMLTAVVCDLVMRVARSHSYTKRDISSSVLALTLVLMFPASVEYSVVISSTLVAILIGKYAFGGLHHYPFNPAAVGYATAVVSWPDILSSYPMPFTVVTSVNFASINTVVEPPEYALRSGGLPNIEILDLLMGNFPGPMGTTFILVLVAAMILLLVRKGISIAVVGSYLATCAAIILLFPRVEGADPITLLIYEFCSGALLFSTIFIVADNVVLPHRRMGKVIYAVVLGIATMYFRYYGAFEYGVCFAAIVVSSLCAFFDLISDRAHHFLKKKGFSIG